MRVLVREAELFRRLAFEIELDHDRGLVSHHPTVVSRLDGNRHARFEGRLFLFSNSRRLMDLEAQPVSSRVHESACQAMFC